MVDRSIGAHLHEGEQLLAMASAASLGESYPPTREIARQLLTSVGTQSSSSYGA